jgi:hypothetical protein
MADTPFDCIESAHEYLRLLAWQVEDVQKAIEGDVEEAIGAGAARRVDALRVVDYKLKQLAEQLGSSRRILNDLRMLRRLLIGNWDDNELRIHPAAPQRTTGASRSS